MLKFFILKALDKFFTFCCVKQNCMCVCVQIIENENFDKKFDKISLHYKNKTKNSALSVKDLNFTGDMVISVAHYR